MAKRYRPIGSLSGLTAGQAEALAGVFLCWLYERFGNLTCSQIVMILDLPDIQKIRAGREFIAHETLVDDLLDVPDVATLSVRVGELS